ncbi:MAG: EAL domain-containing protein [Campylobacterales bacterium]|nr:EAL domain-containing protein [Campylobacterales bacterium]
MPSKDIIASELERENERARYQKLLGQFRGLLDALPDPVFMKDEELRWIYGNPVILNLYNIPPNDYIGKTEDQLLPPEFAPDCMASDERAKSSGTIGVSEERARDPQGNIHYYEVFKVPSYDESGAFVGLIGIGRDITERKQAQNALEQSLAQQRHLLEYDTLTGLYTQGKFKSLLVASELMQKTFVTLVDIDRFHYFNDIFGTELGDEFLRLLARALEAQFTPDVTLGRLGGNTFGLLGHCSDPSRSKKIVERIYEVIEHLNATFGKTHRYRFTLSIGIAWYDKTQSPLDLISRADIALHVSKKRWGNSFHFYDEEHTRVIREKIYLHHQIVDLIEDENCFTLYYQPIVDVLQPKQRKCEALLRLIDAQGNFSLHERLILAAESFGLIGEVTIRVIERAFAQQQMWDIEGLEVELSINLSGDDLMRSSLCDEVASLAARYAVDPHRIVFEVTERQAFVVGDEAANTVNALKAQGFRFALDDFGVGFSSLDNLKRLAFDFVKIDGSFVKEATHSHTDMVVLKAITEIAEAYGMQSIAEYVENESVVQVLSRIGITKMQGWHFAKAMDAASLERFWREAAKAYM